MTTDFEIEANVGICANCKELEGCNKYCILHAGKALYEFINRVDMIETRIGECESREKNGPQDLIVSGHQLFDLNNPSWLLTDIKTTLDASNKFKDLYGKNPVQLINCYGDKAKLNKDDINDTIDKIKKLNRNKLIVLPFKPHTQCNVDIDTETDKQRKKDCKITFLKWTTDKETYKLNCEICFNIPGAFGQTTYKLPITDYITKFRISQIDMQAKSKDHDDSLIQMTQSGIIQPIAIKNGHETLAVDGTYVYLTSNSDTRIIGYWNEKDELLIDSKLVNSKMLNKIKNNKNYIANHKRYIAPYMLFPSTEIIL